MHSSGVSEHGPVSVWYIGTLYMGYTNAGHSAGSAGVA